jgi:hypothetical protein
MAQRSIQRQKTKSKQPRFDPVKSISSSLFSSNLYGWMIDAFKTEVPYGASDSRSRDTWLSDVWRTESHMAGVINSVMLIDANRGWTLVGGRNQVNRYTEILHGLDNNDGYRSHMMKTSLSFYTTDLGSIEEVGREGKNGPMRTLWSVDPTRCYLTGDMTYPLSYTPETGGAQQFWKDTDYLHTSSMLSYRESLKGLGYCALSRSIELAKIMVGVVSHDQEELRAKAMDGLMLLKGITEDQWDMAMQDRAAQMTQKEREYFGGVFVLASMQDIAAQLITLSTIPSGFDRKTWTDLYMYGLALCFGYSPDEFWPVQFGSLGRGEEAGMQHRMATAKGGQAFASMWQEGIQKELPKTLLYQLDERDVEGERMEALLDKEKISNVTAMYKGDANYAGLITRDEGRQLLAEQGLIPGEWTVTEEDVTVTDEEPEARKRLLQNDYVMRAAYQFPTEPIVSYHFQPETNKRITTTLLPYGAKLLSNRSYSFQVKRQDKPEDKILWTDGDVTITQVDVDKAILEARNRVDADFAEMLEAKPYE